MSKALSYKEVKNFIEGENGNGCRLLSENYVNAHTPLNIQCKCGNVFITNFNKFKSDNKKQCNECVKLKRWTYDEVKEFIEKESKSSCKLLSKEYKDSRMKLIIQCKCGNQFMTTFNHFTNQNKQQCVLCGYKKRGEKIRTTHREFVNKVYELEGCNYSVLSMYEIANKKIKIKHNKCGNIYYVKPNNFLTGYRCPRCARNEKKTTEIFKNDILKKFPNNEYILLSEYKNYTSLIKIKHNISSCGYEWRTRPVTFINGKGCPKCSLKRNNDKKRMDFKYVKQYIESKGYKLISNSYQNAYQKLIVKCRNNHITKINWRDFNRGVRCSICSESRGEQKIRYYLEKYNVSFKEQYIFEDLKDINVLRFDFGILDSNDDLHCLVEFDGIFHYKPVTGIDNFKYQKKHDKLKNEYCKKNNIKLLRIPYWELDNGNIKQVLIDNDILKIS